MVKGEYEVAQTVVVTLDETKFTPKFMAEFRESFFDFDTINDHAKHLAQLYARGITAGWSDEFVEGYGLLGDMGISFKVVDSGTFTLAELES